MRKISLIFFFFFFFLETRAIADSRAHAQLAPLLASFHCSCYLIRFFFVVLFFNNKNRSGKENSWRTLEQFVGHTNKMIGV